MFACLGLVCALVVLNQGRGAESILREAEEFVVNGKSDEALRILQPLLTSTPPDGDASYLAGQTAARRRQFADAVKWFGQVPVGHPQRAEACFRAGDILLLSLHQLSPAETFLREALALQPSHHSAQGHLAGLYGLCGLTSLTTSLRFERLKAGQFAEVDLMLLALSDTAAENAASLVDYLQSSPDDPLTLIARGHQAWQQHELAAARLLYERGLNQRPDLDDAQCRLGRILFELSDDSAFLDWHGRLPATAREHPEAWAVRGDWSHRQGDVRGSVRCYWEAARRDPTHRRAHHQLGQCLSSLGDAQLAEAFQRRNACLQELLLAAKQTGLDRSITAAQRTMHAAKLCSHPWEEWGWAEAVRFRSRGQVDSRSVSRPAAELPRVLISAQPAQQNDLSHFPLPVWMQGSQAASVPTTNIARVGAGPIHFVDQAAQTGLHFEYINGDDLPGPGMRIFQFAGGGVGVLDYDRDEWPDLYFTQGGRWPVPESQPPSDVLFRNCRGMKFENVTITAGIFEADYSQGLAVADINGDGWEDLFIANVAGNRLFRNNGDGTFDDITQSANVSDGAWSTSAVCADFNGDALPDLFVVNYLAGPGLLDRICQQSNGVPRACTPHEFDASEDQLLLNLGDGRFRDISAEAGVLAPGGKGLGVVAADFNQSGRLSLFVGNDTTANFFFHNVTAKPGDVPLFVESAVVTGLAFDREGRSLACMGIAADDADGDEQLDLFVTNYYNESNTFYQRTSNLLFSDVTGNAGLREPSLKQLGFGTQFLDTDLDGWLDLVVTNGHVDDETARGIPLQMSPQIFRNIGQGRFIEVSAQELGEWFQRKYLGRGLARLDWNRDGRDDFAVSHLDSPAALLTNETPRQGHFLSIQLVGTVSARDAIGTTVRVKTSSRSRSRQLTAGDGYQASNERRLIFGVEQDERVDIFVRWPSGREDTFRDIETDTAWIAIEGRLELVQIGND